MNSSAPTPCLTVFSARGTFCSAMCEPVIHARSRAEQREAMQSSVTTETASSNSIFECNLPVPGRSEAVPAWYLPAPSGSEAMPAEHFRAPCGSKAAPGHAKAQVAPQQRLCGVFECQVAPKQHPCGIVGLGHGPGPAHGPGPGPCSPNGGEGLPLTTPRTHPTPQRGGP